MGTNAQGDYEAGPAATPQSADSTQAYLGATDPLDLFGFNRRAQAAADAQNAAANRGYWDTLHGPSQQQLTAQYDPRGQMSQQETLAALQQMSRGGLTSADRGMLQASQTRDMQQARSQQQALTQQMGARGMGGSGLDAATQMMASQQGQQQASDAESQLMSNAQTRALQAMQAQGQLATQMRQQGQHEAEQPVDAAQQVYQNQMQRAAGATGQYSTDVGSRNAAAGRQQQQQQGLAGLVGGILTAL